MISTISTSQDWPIVCAMLPFPDSQSLMADDWVRQLAEVAFEGFTAVDLTDSWVRPGDLSPERLSELGDAFAAAGVRPLTLSAIRRSVIDPERGEDNLDYSHRTLEAAAELGMSVVSVGFHRPLLKEQSQAFWFWLADGPHDSTDSTTWALAVSRIRELGRHAGDLGLELSLEMYEDTLLGLPDLAVCLVDEIGLDNVGLNPDLGNLFRLHRPIPPFMDWIETCAPRMNFWHIKSYFRDEDLPSGTVTTVPAPMEIGSINYRQAIKRAVELGFRAPFCVEHYGGDGLSVSAMNARYIRRMLAVATGEAAQQILHQGETK